MFRWGKVDCRDHLKYQGIDGVFMFKSLRNNRPGQFNENTGSFVRSITILPLFLKKKSFAVFFSSSVLASLKKSGSDMSENGIK